LIHRFPLGITQANTLNLTLKNTSLRYNPFNLDSIVSPFVTKDVKIDVNLVYFDDNDSEILNLGKGFFVDEWNMDSSSMTITAQCRDSSKFLQEISLEDGILFQNVPGSTAITNLAKYGGVPESSIQSSKTWYDQVIYDNPSNFWRLGENPTRLGVSNITKWYGRWWAKTSKDFFVMATGTPATTSANYNTIDFTNFKVKNSSDYFNGRFETYLRVPQTGELQVLCNV
jgi:hypothetical protein